MAGQILAGPFLGFEGDTAYTVCFLAGKDVSAPVVVVDNQDLPAERIRETPSGAFWRAEIAVRIAKKGKSHKYQIRSGGSEMPNNAGVSSWEFFVPGTSDRPRIAYASCNGFSSPDLKTKVEDAYEMWTRMADDHQNQPFSLLIMGGDQLYADEMWNTLGQLAAWSKLDWEEKLMQPAGPRLKRELDGFYESLYVSNWNQKEMSLMMASVPTLMMWDDHDIFDGWGSYPDKLQNCPVYRAVFEAARRYFELFQIRSLKNKTLLNPNHGHYSFAVPFRDCGIVALDNRSGRTMDRVMTDENWDDVKKRLAQYDGKFETLLLLSAVPVVYRSYPWVENAFELTPWQDELTDDVRDQWTSGHHDGERMKLIMNLLNFRGRTSTEPVKRVILSGDVHVGCLGVIRDRREPLQPRVIHQVVSSAIVHPAPSWYEWAGIEALTSDEPENLEGVKITTEILKPYSAGKFLRTRNYITLEEGADKKLWVNWVCENGAAPEYPIEASA